MTAEAIEVLKVELFIPGELKDELIIYDMIKNFDLKLKIIEASFSTESGWAYLIIESSKKEMARLFDFLKQKGVSVEVRE